MKKRILLLTLFAGFGSFAISSYRTGPAANGYDCTGAESAGTGSYANPTGCTTGSCHAASANTNVSVTIQLDSAGIALTHYIGGNTYTVRISGNNGTGTTFPYFGFQLTSMKGTTSATTVSNAGTWATTGLPARIAIIPPGHYTQLSVVEHNDTIAVINDTFSRSFTWTAPAAGTGTISFWGAANFVDGNDVAGYVSGDQWNTNHLIITELVNTSSVATVSNNISIKAFPNPAITNLIIQMDNAQEGAYTLRIFDLDGRMVTNENISVNGASYTAINTDNWAPGLYDVVLQKDGFSKTIPVIKR